MSSTTVRQPLQKMSLQPLALAAIHWTLDEQRDMFDLNPPYQRGSVWSVEQRRALIKSMLLGIPIGSVVYNVRDTMKPRAVVDGKQRIEAVRAFFDSEFAVPAWWFEEDDREVAADGDLTFDDLSVRGRRRVQMLQLPGLEAHVKTVEEEAEIFDLINTAGTEQDEATIAAARAIAAGAA